MAGTHNPLLPEMATVIETVQETHNIKTFRVRFDDEEKMKNFTFQPGQVGQLSVFGVGESTFVINSSPTRMDYLQFSVMKAGENTAALHKPNAGDKIGVRAPLGNWFPYEQWKGKNVFFIGGGIGMAPIRTIMVYLLDNRKDYGDISLLYGAKTPADLSFQSDMPEWLERKDLNVTLTIDNPADGWEHKVGLIPNVLKEIGPKPKNVGDVLANTLASAGLQVLHDRTIYDYPSYTGSYNRSGAAVQEYLNQYPSLRIVIDLHRDALCSDSVVYKTVAELPDAACSQVMLLVGTNASGLYHPYWEENLRLAVYLQDAVNAAHPTLMRPITLVNERYNQHLTRGSLIIEVGSSGNTLQEAIRAVRLFGESAGPALAELVQ